MVAGKALNLEMGVRFPPPQPYFFMKGGFIETSTMVTFATFKSVIDAITAQVSVQTIVGVLASAAAIAIAFVFMWWGVRKVTRMVMGSARSGSIRP